MGQVSVFAAVGAVVVMIASAVFATPRLRARSQEEDKRRALTVLAAGLSVAAVLTLAAIGTHLLGR